MEAEHQTPDLSSNSGMMAGVLLDTTEAPRFTGDRPAEIRRLSLKYPELSQSQIGAIVGCTQQRVSEVLVQFLVDTSPEKLEDYRSNKPAVFEALQYRTLASITQDDIANSSYMQRVTAAAILQDKIQLMRGQPTAIHVNVLVNVLDALRLRDGYDDD